MDDKNLMDKTADAVTNAAQTVTEGLKSAGEAVAEAITPKPIRAGDKLIIPSTDPSMPPVIVPVRKRARRKTASRRTRTAKTTRGTRRSSSAAKPSRSAVRKSKATKRKGARKTSRQTAVRRSRKAARH